MGVGRCKRLSYRGGGGCDPLLVMLVHINAIHDLHGGVALVSFALHNKARKPVCMPLVAWADHRENSGIFAHLLREITTFHIV